MFNALMENHIENIVRQVVGDRAMWVVTKVGKIASKQGGATDVENIRILGKKVLIGLGVTVVVIQTVSSVVGFVVSRRNEEKRVERIVRRVIQEERVKEAFAAKASTASPEEADAQNER